MTRVEARPLWTLTPSELYGECCDWMDKAVYFATELGNAKDLLRELRDVETPDTEQRALIEGILNRSYEPMTTETES